MKITHLISVVLEHALDRMCSGRLPIMEAEEGSNLFAHVGMVPFVAAGVNDIEVQNISFFPQRGFEYPCGPSREPNLACGEYSFRAEHKKQDEDINILLYGCMGLLSCFLHLW